MSEKCNIKDIQMTNINVILYRSEDDVDNICIGVTFIVFY